MYPETDVPDIVVTEEMKGALGRSLPEPWETTVGRLTSGYSLSRDLALKVYDSGLTVEFEELSGRLRLEPSLIASVLVDLPPRLTREGVPEKALGPTVLAEALEAVDSGSIAKEAVPEVLKAVGVRGGSVSDAARALGLRGMDESEAGRVVDEVVARHMDLVKERKEGSFSPLMGEAMRELRGKADGELVGRLLKRSIEDALRKA